MDIAEVSKKAGVPASTLRFYEEKGLIASTGRQGMRRRFAPGVLDQLALIALALLAISDLSAWITLAFPVWVLVVSVVILLRPGRTGAPAVVPADG